MIRDFKLKQLNQYNYIKFHEEVDDICLFLFICLNLCLYIYIYIYIYIRKYLVKYFMNNNTNNFIDFIHHFSFIIFNEKFNFTIHSFIILLYLSTSLLIYINYIHIYIFVNSSVSLNRRRLATSIPACLPGLVFPVPLSLRGAQSSPPPLPT